MAGSGTDMDETAFREIYDAYNNRLYGYVLAIVHLPHVAEEITQEIFVKVWTSRDLFGEVADMERYLITTARNRTLNYLRKAGNDARLLEELKHTMVYQENPVEDHITTREYEKLVAEALGRLSPQRRRVFTLSRYQHLRLEEIAEELSLSRSTVKNHLVAALQVVRAYLREHGVTLVMLCLLML